MVLQTQQWLNATYGSVSGFGTVLEDGVTGWGTMYALTRALQHELGITALSNAFGPATLTALTAHGDITIEEGNTNILKLVQGGLYCKGYNGGGLDGTFPSIGVQTMMTDMGLGDLAYPPKLPPKVFKALLTMDAYIVVQGGNETVRSIQRWLNDRYYPRSGFFIIPADGNFSRDVQKALYLAIQYELGMSDSQATGVFGPGTRAGLQAHPLAVGSTGVFVQLFTAAMVFNRVRQSNGAVYLNFKSTFDTNVSAAVSDFQGFSELPVNGTGDFATWCQLLVSTGDPDRPATACDCIDTVTNARALALKAAGYTVIGRYLDERPSSNPLNKWIQPGELDTIFSNGLRVFPISQYYGGAVGYFSWSQGKIDAEAAHDKAESYGFRAGTTIYFAVDYDATDPEITSNIIPYFRGVVAGLANKGKKYHHGVYGARNVCSRVTRETYARWSFVSGMSAGFSGNMGFPLPENWSFNQIQTVTVGTGSGVIEIDKNAHKTGTDPGVDSVGGSASNPVAAFCSYVDQLYQLAGQYNQQNGNSFNLDFLVLGYIRATEYNDEKWATLAGIVHNEFVQMVDGTGLQRIEYFPDPFYGYDFKVRHFAAVVAGITYNGAATGGINRGDFCGWGGDWVTFYAEWRRDIDSYASGYTYCEEKLFKDGVVGSFKIRDLIEDSDAHNVAMKVLAGTPVNQAIRSYYETGEYMTRFGRFYQSRFNGNPGTAKSTAADMLLPSGDITLDAYKNGAIQQIGGFPTVPPLVETEKLNLFCQGWADSLQQRVNQELGSS